MLQGKYFFHCKVCMPQHVYICITWKCSLCHCTDIPAPVRVRAEVTADNTSIRVSWQWESRQSLLMCVDLVRVHYQPEGGSLMMYTVGNTTTVTSATLPNLWCNTNYTIWVYVESGSNQTGNTSNPLRVSLPARGMYICTSNNSNLIIFTV